jgi:hypothetical protein
MYCKLVIQKLLKDVVLFIIDIANLSLKKLRPISLSLFIQSIIPILLDSNYTRIKYHIHIRDIDQLTSKCVWGGGNYYFHMKKNQ